MIINIKDINFNYTDFPFFFCYAIERAGLKCYREYLLNCKYKDNECISCDFAKGCVLRKPRTGLLKNKPKTTGDYVGNDFTKFLSIKDSIYKEGQFEPVKMHYENNTYYPCDGVKRISSLVLSGNTKVKIYIDNNDDIWTRDNTLNGNYFLYLPENVKSDYLLYKKRLLTRIYNLDKLNDIINKTQPAKGHYNHYQSLKHLGINGIRSTDERYDLYKIEDVINHEMNILDIGCNIGCFDFLMSEKVNSIDGFDNCKEHIDTANKIKELIKADNCNFQYSEINNFKSNKKYDFIMSLAVHSNNINRFSELLNLYKKYLKPGGHLLIESRNYDEGRLFIKIINILLNNGFSTERNGQYQDIKEIRKYYMMRYK